MRNENDYANELREESKREMKKNEGNAGTMYLIQRKRRTPPTKSPYFSCPWGRPFENLTEASFGGIEKNGRDREKKKWRATLGDEKRVCKRADKLEESIFEQSHDPRWPVPDRTLIIGLEIPSFPSLHVCARTRLPASHGV